MTSNTETNKAIAREFLDAISSCDGDRIVSYLHEDATWWVSGTLPGISGTSTKEQMRAALNQMPVIYKPGTMRVIPGGFTAEGDRVAVEARSEGELHNGRSYRNTYHFLFVLRDGKLAEIREYIDSHHAYEIFLVP